MELRFHEWTYLARVLKIIEMIEDKDRNYRHDSFEEIFTSGTFVLDDCDDIEYVYILDLDKYRFIFCDGHKNLTMLYSIFKLPNFVEYEEQRDIDEDERFFWKDFSPNAE